MKSSVSSTFPRITFPPKQWFQLSTITARQHLRTTYRSETKCKNQNTFPATVVHRKHSSNLFRPLSKCHSVQSHRPTQANARMVHTQSHSQRNERCAATFVGAPSVSRFVYHLFALAMFTCIAIQSFCYFTSLLPLISRIDQLAVSKWWISPCAEGY